MSQYQSLFEPRARIERRSQIEVEFEIPAGMETFAFGNSIMVNAGPLGYLSAHDAAAHGLVKIVSPQPEQEIISI